MPAASALASSAELRQSVGWKVLWGAGRGRLGRVGRSPASPASALTRIIGGAAASPGSVPWQASLAVSGASHSVPECGFEGLKTYQAPAHIWDLPR